MQSFLDSPQDSGTGSHSLVCFKSQAPVPWTQETESLAPWQTWLKQPQLLPSQEIMEGTVQWWQKGVRVNLYKSL